MKIKPLALSAVIVLVGAHTSAANPMKDTCSMLAAIGANNPDAVESALSDIGARWQAANRTSAIQQMRTLASGNTFAGGNAYRISKLGDDVEEHIVLLRLRQGEVSAMRLRYEWTPDGLKLVSLEAKRKVTELTQNRVVIDPPLLDCS